MPDRGYASMTASWAEANRTYLQGELARVRATLESALAGKRAACEPPTPIPAELVEHGPAIVRLCRSFGLSRFDRDLVLVCAAAELDVELVRTLPPGRLSLGLVIAAFGGDPGALAPTSPLRRFRIIEVAPGPVIAAPLALDERVVHYLRGYDTLDARLATTLREVTASTDDASVIATSVRTACERATGSLLVGLFEGGARERQATAFDVSRALGHRLFRLRGVDLPGDIGSRQTLRTLWERECRLQAAALLVELDDDAPIELARVAAALLQDLEGLSFMSSRVPISVARSSCVTFKLPRTSRERRIAHLRRALGERAIEAGPMVERVATQFALGADAIERACLSVTAGEVPLDRQLWNACREMARPRLDDVAQRIEPIAGWNDLVVPPETRTTLEALAGHVRHRAQVYDHWGFGERSNRGLGTGALFTGPSGTGKTLAAEILAREAGLDLYHIDLSQIVNKYVGETEKNLRRVFDAAEDSGAILLFDEADALFGKRGEVEKGTDRYANIEVSYLLQRMEAYRGLAILTTNQREAIDNAFLRRLRFLVAFPFPDASLRAELWQRAFPRTAPLVNIDLHRLARLQLAGGNIRNIAVNAAFLAADRGEAISMKHLLAASRAEFVKIERPFPEAEVQGWPS